MQLLFAIFVSTVITTFAIISAVITISTVVITMLLSYVVLFLKSNPNEMISLAVNSSNMLL